MVLIRLFLLAFLLCGSARAEVHLTSVVPGEVTVRTSDGRERRLSVRQQAGFPCSDSHLEVEVRDAQGRLCFQGRLADGRHWILRLEGPEKVGVVEAGFHDSISGTPQNALAIFNSTPYHVQVTLYSAKTEELLDPFEVPSMQASAPVPVGEGGFKVYLKDEGGNPIGESYSRVSGGKFFLLYRKEGSRYDVDTLGRLITPKTRRP